MIVFYAMTQMMCYKYQCHLFFMDSFIKLKVNIDSCAEY